MQGKGKKAKHKSFTDRAEAEEFMAEQKKAKEKDKEENKDAEKQTNNDGEKPEELSLEDCQFDGRDIEGHEKINCDLCNVWYPIFCVDLKVNQAQELSAWICKPCKTCFQS